MSNEIQKVEKKTLTQLLADTDSHVYEALKNSVYPGAKDESIAMVLAYCKSKKYDPLAKAVHIVPMSVKDSKTGRYDFRDVIMPGIASYRIDAERTGLYMGISEPDFGPDVKEKLGEKEVTYPEWCKMTLRKYNPRSKQVIEFSVKEYWKENYATKGKNKETQLPDLAPNAMWEKRPRAQLAKCTEAQCLRRAFSDILGGMVTFEEMEGKDTKGVSSIIEVLETQTVVDQLALDVLRDKMNLSDTKEIDICNFLKIGCLEEMLAKDFQGVVRQLDRKVSLKKKTDSLAINQELKKISEEKYSAEEEKASEEFLLEMGEDE